MEKTKQTYENHLDEQEARWFAVYTKYKREKLVTKRLQEKGIEAYLPLQHFTRNYVRKIKHVEIPLISCYVFTRITKKDYIPVLDTPDVVQFVRFSKNLIAIPEREMQIMKRVVGENMDIEVEASNFVTGQPVEIVSGNLTGLKGKLIDKGHKNFLIELENLSYAIRMHIDPSLLQAI
jgi:transcription antitermination factor NusG